MLHHRTYDDLDHLKVELEQEKRYRETIEWSNAELERSISELETYLHDEENSRGADDNEWKVRFESQTALNKQLQEQKDWLEAELIEARRKLTTGSYPEAMNYNLDALNEPELLRLVKHLERMRNDFYSALRDAEWKLDKESKDFHHFDEMRRVYKVDLKHANHTIERMRLSNILDPSGLVTPIYPPGYFRWLDTHTPIPFPMNVRNGGFEDGGGNDGTKQQNKKGGGGKSHGKSESNQNPPRSKSRAEKKSKKKEEPLEEPNPTVKRDRNGGTENGNGTDRSGGDQDMTGKQSNLSSGGDSYTKDEGTKPTNKDSSKDRGQLED